MYHEKKEKKTDYHAKSMSPADEKTADPRTRSKQERQQSNFPIS
jgi:hypothetical protein